MKVIKIKLKKRSYSVIIGANIIVLLGKYLTRLGIGNSAYVITNKLIKNRYGRLLNKVLKKSDFNIRFKLVPDSEKSKSIKTASLIIEDITRYDKGKRLFIIAFGGGVIGDLAGFVASIYKRGIPYIQIPTTLLAQVDSSIGGKTAVDLRSGKNLVGAFYQPRLVFSDVDILKTLDLRQLRNGLAEVIKYGAIKDPALFVYLEKRYKDILGLKRAAMEFIVRRSALIKAGIVHRDEREEKGIRTILNFGHTLGHAIEAAADYKKYSHGEAIALGMLVACDIGRKLRITDEVVCQRMKNLIKAVGLPTKIQKAPLRDIIKAHYYDKKFIGSKNRFVIIKNIGRTKIKENIPIKIIKEALKKNM
jgi:3-dehydroquinate synthase